MELIFKPLNINTSKELIPYQLYLVLLKEEEFPVFAFYTTGKINGKEYRVFTCYPIQKAEIWQMDIDDSDNQITHFAYIPTSHQIKLRAKVDSDI